MGSAKLTSVYGAEFDKFPVILGHMDGPNFKWQYIQINENQTMPLSF